MLLTPSAHAQMWDAEGSGDLQHEGSSGVTIPNGCSVFVIQGSLVQVLHPVLLGPVW